MTQVYSREDFLADVRKVFPSVVDSDYQPINRADQAITDTVLHRVAISKFPHFSKHPLLIERHSVTSGEKAGLYWFVHSHAEYRSSAQDNLDVTLTRAVKSYESWVGRYANSVWKRAKNQVTLLRHKKQEVGYLLSKHMASPTYEQENTDRSEIRKLQYIWLATKNTPVKPKPPEEIGYKNASHFVVQCTKKRMIKVTCTHGGYECLLNFDEDGKLLGFKHLDANVNEYVEIPWWHPAVHMPYHKS